MTPDGHDPVDCGRGHQVDASRFAQLCERHRTRLWRVVASIACGPDAEDLAQEALVRAFCARHTYRGESPFDAWLCRIAVNAAHDYRRSAWRRRVLLGRSLPEQAGGEAPDAEAARRDVQRRVRRAVAELPAPQRVPIWLHYFEEYSVVEVARLERVPESTVRSRMKAGLRRLAGRLGDLDDWPALQQAGAAEGCKV